MTARPAVSVVMAAYNGAALIGETLKSLSAQTMADFEVLVVDDCSTDDTRAVVAAWPDRRVRLIALEANGGPVRARNRALAEARGRHIAGLDQDDLCHPARFERQVALLDREPDVALVATASRVFEGAATRASAVPPITTPALLGWLLRISNPIVWSSVMVRGDVARRLDPFTDPDRLYAEDFDLYHRIAAHGRIVRIDDELLFYRDHPGGASNRHGATMIDSAGRVLERAYLAEFGRGAGDAARLVAAHVMAGAPVPDRATLARLGTVLVTLQRQYLAQVQPAAECRKLIRWETARLWWRVARRAVRSGTLALSDVIAVRPPHLGLGHAGIDDLVMSGLVGSVRAAQRRRAGTGRAGPVA